MSLLRDLLSLIRGDFQNLEKLKKRGLKVGKDFHRMYGCVIDPSHCFHISIGDNVRLAPKVHILAHDGSTVKFLGKVRAANVRIGNDVWIGTSAIILPGVTIGNRVVIGAGSVVTKDIPDNSVAVGNPARVICTLDAYLEKISSRMRDENTFGGLWYEGDPERCHQAIAAADKYGEIFVY